MVIKMLIQLNHWRNRKLQLLLVFIYHDSNNEFIILEVQVITRSKQLEL